MRSCQFIIGGTRKGRNMFVEIYHRCVPFMASVGGMIGLVAGCTHSIQTNDTFTPQVAVHEGTFITSCYVLGRCAGIWWPATIPCVFWSRMANK